MTGNVVSPGVIATEIVESNLGPEEMVVLQGQISLHRLGKPGEIAPGVAFLASDAALHVNGAVIDVPGGRCEFVFP